MSAREKRKKEKNFDFDSELSLSLTHLSFSLFSLFSSPLLLSVLSFSRVHSGELPNDWTAYMDTDGGIPYYYNSRTSENTYVRFVFPLQLLMCCAFSFFTYININSFHWRYSFYFFPFFYFFSYPLYTHYTGSSTGECC